MSYELNVPAESVRVEGTYGNYLDAYITVNDVATILEEIGVATILDEIGEEECRKHFGIEEAE